MKIVMVSNYINHHQVPFSDAMYKRLGEDYTFIQTMPMEDERANMGWGVDETSVPYLLCAYDEPDKARELILNCDMLLAGWTPDRTLIEERQKSGKLTLCISERIYREGQWKCISPKGLIAKYKEHIRFRKLPSYLLCNGAYVASDFSIIHAYPNKKYRFGYFPATREYEDVRTLMEKKTNLEYIEVEFAELLPEELPNITDKCVDIVWAGRFLELKHPEFAVYLASDLCNLGYRFHIHMIGDGELREKMENLAKYEMIEDYITFYGNRKPEEVRDIMEKCHIHIFTSNFIEGWGAVVNEGMNAGCAEVVNDEVGCAKFLIEDGENGLLYHDGSYEDFREKVVTLLNDKELMHSLGVSAYRTITEEWNAETAADRVIDFYEGYLRGELDVPSSGPMSVADKINPGFFKTGKL